MKDIRELKNKIFKTVSIKFLDLPLYEFVYSPIERVTYSQQFIHKFDRVKSFPEEKRRISVAIANYERPEFVIVTLKNIFKDERVSEIIILDDGSSLESFLKSVKFLKNFKQKVKLFRREKNLGPFITKIQACSLCSNPWCILLDSDNTIFESYLNAIFSLETWEENIIYCPDYAFPHYKFKNYRNLIFDFNHISNLQKSSNILKEIIFSCFINGGNYFLNNKRFTKCLEPYLILNPHGTDAFITNYIWLSQGNKLKVLTNASYYHRIHSHSLWILNSHKGIAEYNIIANKFEKEQSASLENLLIDFNSVVSSNENIEYIPL